jgi:pimeloyl-ACP methyl ester carboxylesterase
MINLIEKQIFTFETQDGCQIYGESRGQGPAIVFVYGLACQMNHWIHQIKYLSQFYRVISYDLRGHVKSTLGSPSKLSVEGLAQDLKELLDFLELPQAHLVAHSFGVPILIEFASQQPERTQSLTLINGFATNPLENFFGFNVSKHLLPVFLGLNKEDPVALQKVWSKFVDNPLTVFITGLSGGFNLDVTKLKDIEIYTRGVAHLDLNIFLPLFDSLVNYHGLKSCLSLTQPTLIIGGEQDRVTPYYFQEQLHQHITSSEFVKVPYGSHCCQLDFPDYVNLLIQRHLEGLEKN